MHKLGYFYTPSAETRKKSMDKEWREKWKKCEDEEAFEARLIELKSKHEKKNIFSAFGQSKRKKIKLSPGTLRSIKTLTG